jgi:hypothetical protein
MKVTLLVEKTTKKVLYLEAGADFVDLLFSLLALPIGSLMKLLAEKSPPSASLSDAPLLSLFQSVQNLDNSYFRQADTSRAHILLPENDSKLLALTDVNGSKQKKPVPGFCSGCRRIVNIDPSGPRTHHCPSCRTLQNVTIDAMGFVEKFVTFMVTKNLEVLPTSVIKTIEILNASKVKDMDRLEGQKQTVTKEMVSVSKFDLFDRLN